MFQGGQPIPNEVKITNALYRLLEGFPEGDPLTLRIKEKAVAVLENLSLVSQAGGWTSLKSYFLKDKEKIVETVLVDIDLLQTLLTVAKDQGWLDGVNFLIITKEYRTIKERVEQFQEKKREYGFLGNASEKKSLEENHIGVKNGIREIGQNSNMTVVLPSRKKRILELLRQREGVQVADIIKELPQVTKRTIRRDLDILLKEGKIERTGTYNQISYRIQKNDHEVAKIQPFFDGTSKLS